MTEKYIQTLEIDPHATAIIGQYASDYVLHGLAQVADTTGTLAARGDGDSGLHNEDANSLFDELDVRNPDIATGVSAQEPDELEENGLEVITGYEDELSGDAADDWLKENDPDYGK